VLPTGGDQVGLRRALGLRTVVSTSTGLAFAALEYLAMAGLIAYAAGNLAWVAVAVAGLLALVAWGFYGGFCVIRLRDREPDQVRPFRLWAGKPLAWVGIAVFAILALGASLSVNNRFDPLPLGIVAVMAVLSAGYVLGYLPRLRAANAARAITATKRRRPPIS
jgi:amino acid transporter